AQRASASPMPDEAPVTSTVSRCGFADTAMAFSSGIESGPARQVTRQRQRLRPVRAAEEQRVVEQVVELVQRPARRVARMQAGDVGMGRETARRRAAE